MRRTPVIHPDADYIPFGTFCGEDSVPPGTFHGEDKVPPGTFHSA